MAAAAKSKRVDSLTLTPSQVAEALRSMKNTKRSTFLWGPPGISKSATALQVANAEGIGFIDCRLSQMDPTDLRGIPYPVKENGQHGVRWSAPMLLPRDLDFNVVQDLEAEETLVEFDNPLHATPQISVKSLTKGLEAKFTQGDDDGSFFVGLYNKDGELSQGRVRWMVKGKVRAILALEEFNSAPPSVQAAAYELVLDRRLGSYKVPEGVMIVAMGNRDTDKGVTYKMGTPIANRFVHIEMKPDFDDWQKWALGSRVHPEVVGYLTAFKNQLFDFEPGSASRGFATPRTWEFVSDILTQNEDMPTEVATGLIVGCVGEGMGLQFMEFRKIAADLPDAESILSGSLKKMKNPKTEVSLAYALTTTLSYELKERADKVKALGSSHMSSPQRKRWLEEADHYLLFMMDNFQPEICIMGAKAAIASFKLPFDTQKMKHFDTFANRYRDLIMS